MRKLICISFLLASPLWSNPALLQLMCQKKLVGSGELTEADKNLTQFNSLLYYLKDFLSMVPASQSLAQLQFQIWDFLDNSFVAWNAANSELNAMAIPNGLIGPLGIRNFSQVSPLVFRSAQPTLAQAQELIQRGMVNEILSLNIELGLAFSFDPHPGKAWTAVEREKVLTEMVASEDRWHESKVRGFLHYYEAEPAFTLSANTNPQGWHQFIGLGKPNMFLDKYFDVLNYLLEKRKEGKKVLIHCNLGKHRTGLISMLVKALEADEITDDFLLGLYQEYLRFNWNEKAVSRVQYMVALPMIVRSKPFQELKAKWKKIK